ncbi:MAG: hypothetical protein ACR2QB_01035 [Gammaproteobacteria bacterium]
MQARRGIQFFAIGFLGLVLAYVPLAEAESSLTFGAAAGLSDGARALFAGDYDNGISLTRAGLRQETGKRERAAGLSNLCAGYVGSKAYKLAVAACTQAIEIRPSNWRAFNNRALAHLAMGDLHAARSDVTAGMALNPESGLLARVDDMVSTREPVGVFAQTKQN